MRVNDLRRQSLEQLLGLAVTYKGLTRKRLAESLGRDPSKLSRETANPKLDYLIRLAELLDWPVGDVAEVIWSQAGTDGAVPEFPTFDAANDAAKAAHRAGDYAGMLHATQRMARLASTSEERATAAHRESGAWDGMGRYTKEVDAVRRGLQESPITSDLRSLLQANLANTYYMLGYMLEARAMAADLIEDFGSSSPTTRAARAAQAFSHYVHGHACRCLMTQQPDRGPRFATLAKQSLQRSIDLYLPLADEFDNPAWRGIATTCFGGIIEADVELGLKSPDAAIAELLTGLGTVVDSSDGLVGDRLESFGWWCIFGCDIAFRHFSGGDLQRHVAVFTNKGYEIADRLNNWAMRERLFTMEFARRQRLNELAGLDVEWTIDSEEVRVIVGTMGRFPLFKSTGWKILQSATIIDDQ